MAVCAGLYDEGLKTLERRRWTRMVDDGRAIIQRRADIAREADAAGRAARLLVEHTGVDMEQQSVEALAQPDAPSRRDEARTRPRAAIPPDVDYESIESWTDVDVAMAEAEAEAAAGAAAVAEAEAAAAAAKAAEARSRAILLRERIARFRSQREDLARLRREALRKFVDDI